MKRGTFHHLGILSTAVTAVAAFVCTVGLAGAAPSPLLYYDFEEGAGSTISNKAPGVVTDGLLHGAGSIWTAGAPAGASPTGGLVFDGIGWTAGGVYVETQYGANQLGLRDTGYTMTAWLRFTKAAGDAMVFGQIATGSNWLHDGLRNSRAHLGHYGSDIAGVTTLTTGAWYHVAWQFDQGTQRVFVNGKLDNVAAGKVTVRQSDPVVIGDASLAGGRAFQGVLDELTVFDEVLTTEQIQHLVDGGSPNALPEAAGDGEYYTGPYGPGGTWNLYKVVGGAEGVRASWFHAYTSSTNNDPIGGIAPGHLVSIHSRGEQEFVRRLQRPQTVSGQDLYIGDTWIGLTDNDTNSVGLVFPGAQESGDSSVPLNDRRTIGWVWTSGEPYDGSTFMNWSGGEPNDSPSEDAVRIHYNGLWSDYGSGIPGSGDPTNNLVYIVEWDIGAPTPIVHATLDVKQVDPVVPAMLPGPEGGDGSFGAHRAQDAGTIGEMRVAARVLASGAGTIATTNAGIPMINTYDPDVPGDANSGFFPNNDPVFGDTQYVTNDPNYVIVYKGRIRIGTADQGRWTFGVRSDDGFALRIVGQTWLSAHGMGWIDHTDRSVLTHEYVTGNSNTRGVIDLGVGDYLVEFVAFQGSGGQYQELFAARGEWFNEADTDAWRLVGYKGIGDYSVPGVMAPGWTAWHSTPFVHGTIGNTGEAWNAVSPYVASGSNRTTWADINFLDPESGAEHELPNSVPFPFDSAADDNNVAMYMTARLQILSNDTYHLGFRGDDGSWLQVEGQTWDSIVHNQTGNSYIEQDKIALNQGTGDSRTIGAITLPIGEYTVNALWWEATGGASFDLFCGNSRVGPPYVALAEGGAGVRNDHDGLSLVKEEYDWGDAPDSYSTLAASMGASHSVVHGAPFLGQFIDIETNGQPTAAADGDDNDGMADEDGIMFMSAFVPGLDFTIMVDGTFSPTDGVLNAWIDYDGDGTWLGLNEHVFQNVRIPAGGVLPLTSTVPVSAATGTSYARFRVSSQRGIGYNGYVPDGEVEDYAILIEGGGGDELDWGDAPDPAYPTMSSSTGAYHMIGGPWLGDGTDVPDPEMDGQQDPNALGDDNNDGNDDEDGVAIPVLLQGQPGSIRVTVGSAGGIGGWVDGWIDFDGDGTWSPAESVVSGMLSTGTHAISVTPPPGSVVGQTFARFRINSTGALPPTGGAGDGEVEDHEVIIEGEPAEELDWGDAPDPQYPTMSFSTGAYHVIGGPWLGDGTDVPDPEMDGQQDPNALGDDNNDGNDDEDGVAIPVLLQGQPGSIRVTVGSAGGIGGWVDGWIDFDGDGTWSPAESVVSGMLSTGTHAISVTPPPGSVVGQTFARFRINSTGALPPTGGAGDGEVEDHEVIIEGEPVEELDWGDAPDPTFPTLAISTGAYHVIRAGLYLGWLVDAEPDGQPDPQALGDDMNPVGFPSDEDGVQVTAPIYSGGMANIDVIASGSPGGAGATTFLNAWVDFDSNGWWGVSEQIFKDVVLVAGTNSLTFSVPPVRAGRRFARFRYSTQSNLWTTGGAPDGEVEDHALVIEEEAPEELDWGDAPDPLYPTMAASTGAYHVIGGPWLGDVTDVPDREMDGQQDPTALGDDNDGNDDEDGVTIPVLVQGQATNITVEVNSQNGLGGVLEVWIDYDGDGVWSPVEQVFAGPQINGTHAIPVTAPPGSVVGQTFARFRISTMGGLSPTGRASDGEVEDHEVIIEGEPVEELDWGDAPDPTFPTLAISTGAYHVIRAGLYLGWLVDAEPDGQPDPQALGDDMNPPALPPDEDGVQVTAPIYSGGMANIDVIASGSPGGAGATTFLNAWVDFDSNGWWGVSEQIFKDVVLVAGTNSLTFSVPPVRAGRRFARFRYSTQSNLWTTGGAPDGEVEDHALVIEEEAPEELDWGDAPDPLYPTMAASTGAYHVIGGPWLGDLSDVPDPEMDGQQDANALGDDNNDGNDDEDGVVIPTLTIGQTASVRITVGSATGGAWVDGWIDADGDGTWSPAETVVSGVLSTGTHSLSVTPPPGSVVGQTFARFRINSRGALPPTGGASDGEVEDHEVIIEGEPPDELDWGDAPDPTFPTLAISTGAYHVIRAGLYLGWLVDAELDGQPDPQALGDDMNPPAQPSDEDGVQVTAPIYSGGIANIDVIASGSAGGVGGTAYLNAWVDFNSNGWWDASEQIFTDLILAAGTNSLTFNVPPVPAGRRFARFRYSTQSNLWTTGGAPDGEVEDHELVIEEEEPEELDWGDAPDPLYPTMAASTGAYHVIGGPWLGDLSDVPDGELDGQHDPNALGDDNFDGNDDEDGVTIPPLVQGQAVNVTVEVNSQSGQGGGLDVWIDYDGDGTWSPSENVFGGSLPDGVHVIPVTAPRNSVVGQTFARFRISTSGGLSPTGRARDGEVEDHEVTITEGPGDEHDWGDAPRPYPTLAIETGAYHVIAGPFMGALVDSETDGVPTLQADGDDLNGAMDDEDGITFPGPLVRGSTATVLVDAVNSPSTARINAWIDFDGDGAWSTGGTEQILVDAVATAGMTNTLTFPVPWTARMGRTYARFRCNTAGGLAPSGGAFDGEVEDYVVDIYQPDPGPIRFTDSAWQVGDRVRIEWVSVSNIEYQLVSSSNLITVSNTGWNLERTITGPVNSISMPMPSNILYRAMFYRLRTVHTP